MQPRKRTDALACLLAPAHPTPPFCNCNDCVTPRRLSLRPAACPRPTSSNVLLAIFLSHRYLLQRDFPGIRIGPEPTTDRFVAIMYGEDERIIPGNALVMQADKPFTGLTKFGSGFLTRLECASMQSQLLSKLTIIDTPGVLAGEKQSMGRSYDFEQVIGWFANRADRILILFDAHKLDISDEFKKVLLALSGNDDKVRVVLNKADAVTTSQLMRVYGSMMWSLGKVIQTPEVMRVYIGSFWNEPIKNESLATLFEHEMGDLVR